MYDIFSLSPSTLCFFCPFFFHCMEYEIMCPIVSAFVVSKSTHVEISWELSVQ